MLDDTTKDRLDYYRDVVLADIASVLSARWGNKMLEDSSARLYDAIVARYEGEMHPDVAGIVSADWIHGVECNGQDPIDLFARWGNWPQCDVTIDGTHGQQCIHVAGDFSGYLTQSQIDAACKAIDRGI